MAEDLPLNPAVAQESIGETICQRGWTKTVRPRFKVTNAIKLAKLRERGLTEADKSRFELDPIIPLALGGVPATSRDLQLPAMAGSRGERCNRGFPRARSLRWAPQAGRGAAADLERLAVAGAER